MFCKECGANIDGARFCPSCGKPVQQMTIQPTKCSKCGAELQEGMKFCNQCGTPVVAMNSQTSPVQSAPPMQPKEQAQQSWKARQAEQENQAKQAREAWQAKLNQGNAQKGQPQIQPQVWPVVSQRTTEMPQSKVQTQQTTEKSKPKTQPQPKAQPQQKKQVSPKVQKGEAHPQVSNSHSNKDQMVQQSINSAGAMFENVAAANSLGKMGFDMAGLLPTESVEEALSPVNAILGGIGGFFGGILGLLKKPWRLIPFALLILAWLFLGNKKGSSDETIKLLSWLTFTEGGAYRDGILGTIGGTLGKGITGAALCSVFMGGIPAFFRGISGIFKSLGKGGSFLAMVFGTVIGAVLYIAFAGYAEAGTSTAIAGISGVILSLEAMGGTDSWIYKIAAALTSKAQDGVRTIREKAANGFLTGMTMGFLIATLFFVTRG